MEVMEIEKSAKQLLEFWGKQKIVSPPNNLDDILYFEFSKNMQLPDDFRRLYMMTNGMVSLFPNYFDDEGFLFYPLQELTTLEEEFNINGGGAIEHCLIFAEFMHKSWWYGVRFSKIEDNYEIGIISSGDKFKVITPSLAEFIHLYLNDSPVLYEY
ncbi:hypothetical protein Q4E93_13185 [Flavitalea sp. BT771]|uniref:SMI1/KNR4 family protein n=1 Tax=Flavitalea sp. BT771 TaxID=3063329 RepID=UPI0026E39FE9|nr:SMI1/KNR4 family protein [Flavitalea sp. BT771]MDO6431552.1 hypothetical protein [Flavitalea sp. BT771]MDV6220460.1 hypothetical protein [Flavitalea sp. BT771]